MSKLKFEELDGTTLVTDEEFKILEIESQVFQILDRMEKVKALNLEVIKLPSGAGRVDAMEDRDCHTIVANRMALYLGAKTFKEYELDKVFGMGYFDLRKANGLSKHPNTQKYRDQFDEFPEGEFSC